MLFLCLNIYSLKIDVVGIMYQMLQIVLLFIMRKIYCFIKILCVCALQTEANHSQISVTSQVKSVNFT